MGGDEAAAAAVGDSRDEKRDVDETTESLTDPESRFDILARRVSNRVSREVSRVVGRSSISLAPLHPPPELARGQSIAYAATRECSCALDWHARRLPLAWRHSFGRSASSRPHKHPARAYSAPPPSPSDQPGQPRTPSCSILRRRPGLERLSGMRSRGYATSVSLLARFPSCASMAKERCLQLGQLAAVQ